jgi:hypothetical protein
LFWLYFVYNYNCFLQLCNWVYVCRILYVCVLYAILVYPMLHFSLKNLDYSTVSFIHWINMDLKQEVYVQYLLFDSWQRVYDKRFYPFWQINPHFRLRKINGEWVHQWFLYIHKKRCRKRNFQSIVNTQIRRSESAVFRFILGVFCVSMQSSKQKTASNPANEFYRQQHIE